MNHRDWQELIPFYVAQTLSSDDLQRFENHLSGCETCQDEIEEWRTIASAVWRQADSAAQALPPLSRDVYSKLNRDRVPRSRYTSDTNTGDDADLPPNVQRIPQQRSNLPLTLVAGTLFAILFGGVLIMIALRPPQSQNASEQIIALNATNEGMTQEAGRLVPADATLAPTDIGIIPTQVPTDTPDIGAPVFLSVTPIPVTPDPFLTPLPQPTNTIVFEDVPTEDFPNPAGLTGPAAVTEELDIAGIQELQPTLTPSPDPNAAPIGGGPYITQIPSDSTCEVFNPTPIRLEVFTRADRNSEIVGVIDSGASGQAISRSLTGWYLVRISSGREGWLQSGSAFLRGNCIDALPVSTVVPTPVFVQPTATMQGASELPQGATIAVISAAFADVYAAPTFDAAIIDTVARNAQFTVLGYQGTGATRWVMVSIGVDEAAWVWGSIVTEYPADQVPPTTTP